MPPTESQSARPLGPRIVRLLVVAALALLTLLGVFWWSIQPTRINDPARYTELLARFPQNVTPQLPKAIPAGATSVSLKYLQGACLGPARTVLRVGFSVTPIRASQLLADAVSTTPTWGRHESGTSSLHEITVSNDGWFSTYRIDVGTGQVIIDASSN